MKLVIIRHGQIYANVINDSGEKLYTGALNNELGNLTDYGIKSSIKLAELKEVKEIQKVYTSDLNRTIDTAKLAKPGFDLIIDKNLREKSLGVFEGLKEDDLLKTDEYKKYIIDDRYNKFRADFSQKPPGGENYQDVILRTKKFLDSLDYNEDITIGIFAHLHSIRCLLYNLFNISPKERIFDLYIKKCEPYVIEKKGESSAKLLSHNLEKMFK